MPEDQAEGENTADVAAQPAAVAEPEAAQPEAAADPNNYPEIDPIAQMRALLEQIDRRLSVVEGNLNVLEGKLKHMF